MMSNYSEIEVKECALIFGGVRNEETAIVVEMLATAAGMLAKMVYRAFKRSSDALTWLNMTREFGAYRR